MKKMLTSTPLYLMGSRPLVAFESSTNGTQYAAYFSNNTHTGDYRITSEQLRTADNGIKLQMKY
jgi:hypothetical protein